MENELPVIDYNNVDYSAGLYKTDQAVKKATERCPSNSIQWLEGDQFADQSGEKERYLPY